MLTVDSNGQQARPQNVHYSLGVLNNNLVIKVTQLYQDISHPYLVYVASEGYCV